MSDTRFGALVKSLNEQAFVMKPFLSHLEHAVAKAIAADDDLRKQVPMYQVAVDEVEPMQHRLDAEQVDKFAQEGNFDGTLGFSRDVVIRSNQLEDDEEYDANNRAYAYGDVHVYLFDGHHRRAAAMKMDQPFLNMYVFNLTSDQDMSLEDFADQLGVSPADLVASMENEDKARYEPMLDEIEQPIDDE